MHNMNISRQGPVYLASYTDFELLRFLAGESIIASSLNIRSRYINQTDRIMIINIAVNWVDIRFNIELARFGECDISCGEEGKMFKPDQWVIRVQEDHDITLPQLTSRRQWDVHNNTHGLQPRLRERVNSCALCMYASPSLPKHKKKHFHYTGQTKCLGLIQYMPSECTFTVLALCHTAVKSQHQHTRLRASAVREFSKINTLLASRPHFWSNPQDQWTISLSYFSRMV